ncbi:MAG TPA: DUF192 domain-containing protein [Pseudobdellovibrionaceae bacterium]|nr:DUF192 domain-containing protein [Pseudobdellovibrionaceae bacterium]
MRARNFIVMLSACILAHAASAESKDQRPKFAKAEVRLAGQRLRLEVADNDSKRAYGLMFVEKLEPNTGMIFIFESERTLSFWMKNTLIPLSIGYFDANRRFVNSHEMLPEVMGKLDLKSYPSTRPAQYAIELPAGWFLKHKLDSKSRFEWIKRP